MSGTERHIPAKRIVVVMPNWLGDGVMATPFLRALRGVYPGARIVTLARGLVAPVCGGLVDEVKVLEKGEEGKMAKWLRGERFELGILLPNSFRSAWMLLRGGVRRRLGYARNGRGILLTDRIRALGRSVERRQADRKRAEAIRQSGGSRRRIGSPYEPVPAIAYYLELAQYLGAENPAKQMELVVSPEERQAAERALQEMGIAGDAGYAVLVPGANFGASKCWLPERFAAVAEQLADPAGALGLRVVVAGSPAEGAISAAIVAALGRQRERVAVLGNCNGGKGVSVGALKEIVRRARLMVCNDTGTRHMAAAFGVPTVTLFGPTDPVWAQTYSAMERIVRIAPPPPCGPCQLKVCPIDHRCMTGVSVEMVMAAVREVGLGA